MIYVVNEASNKSSKVKAPGFRAQASPICKALSHTFLLYTPQCVLSNILTLLFAFILEENLFP